LLRLKPNADVWNPYLRIKSAVMKKKRNACECRRPSSWVGEVDTTDASS